MNQILVVSISAMGGMGVLFGALLAYTSNKFTIKKDERIEKIEGVLPGANCGACGYPGCSAYAEAIVQQGVSISLCPVGGVNVASQVGEIMGVSADTDSTPMVAKVKCQGGINCTNDFEYRGLTDCHAANALHGGSKSCKYGCLGLGSCERVCPFGAIKINGNGVAEVDAKLCTACGICIKECPKKVIDLVPAASQVHVLCKNEELGKIVRQKCKGGCISCKICEKACEFDAIKIVNNVALIDYDRCTGCMKCVEKCPTKVIEFFHQESKAQ